MKRDTKPFSRAELELHLQAQDIMESLPMMLLEHPDARVHEIVRAISDLLHLPCRDGLLGLDLDTATPHSWLVLPHRHGTRGNILDLMAPDQHPSCILVATSVNAEAARRYRACAERTDIRQEALDRLKERLAPFAHFARILELV